MTLLKTVVATVAIGASLTALAGAGVVYSGVYDVGADTPHWDATYWLLNTVRQRSVAAHSADIRPPALSDYAQIVTGAGEFAEMYAGCHMPPGGQMTAIAQGLYPKPPNLAESGAEMPAEQIYWTLEHGIKASAMPAWGDTHSSEVLWALTAFIKQWPDMSPQRYQQLVAEARATGAGGHSHDDGAGHHHEAAGHAHDHGGPPHADGQHPLGEGRPASAASNAPDRTARLWELFHA